MCNALYLPPKHWNVLILDGDRRPLTFEFRKNQGDIFLEGKSLQHANKNHSSYNYHNVGSRQFLFNKKYLEMAEEFLRQKYTVKKYNFGSGYSALILKNYQRQKLYPDYSPSNSFIAQKGICVYSGEKGHPQVYRKLHTQEQLPLIDLDHIIPKCSFEIKCQADLFENTGPSLRSFNESKDCKTLAEFLENRNDLLVPKLYHPTVDQLVENYFGDMGHIYYIPASTKRNVFGEISLYSQDRERFTKPKIKSRAKKQYDALRTPVGVNERLRA